MTSLYLYGMKVFETSYALETTDIPKRKHKRTKSMSENYHRRVQKKWIKRFGYEMKPAMYRTPIGLFVHPALMSELKRACEEV